MNEGTVSTDERLLGALSGTIELAKALKPESPWQDRLAASLVSQLGLAARTLAIFIDQREIDCMTTTLLEERFDKNP